MARKRGRIMTNFEKIKAMDSLEITGFLYNCIANCSLCPAYKSCEKSGEVNCPDRIYEWLESEAEE